MKLLKTFLFFLSIVYFAQFVVCLFSSEADSWSLWTTLEFHAGLWCACLFVAAAKWAHERINK